MQSENIMSGRNTGASVIGKKASLAMAVAMVAAAVSPAMAVDGTWNVATSGNWSATGNWAGGNVAGGAGSIADFTNVDITTNRDVTVDIAARTIGTLLVGDSTAASGVFQNYTFKLGTGGFVFDNGLNDAVLTQYANSGANTINVPLSLTSNLVVTNLNSTSELLLINAISTTAGKGLIIQGPGTIASTVSHSFTGGLNVKSGTYRFTGGSTGANTRLGNGTGTVTIGDTSGSGNATLNYSGGGAQAYSNNFVIAAGNTGVASLTNTTSTVMSVTGTLAVNHEFKLNTGASGGGFTFSGEVSGAQRLLIDGGTGMVTLNAHNAGFTGETKLAQGGLTIGRITSLQRSTLNLAGGTLTVAASLPSATLGGLAGTSDLALSTGLALTSGYNNSTNAYSGVISGSGATFLKIGSGSQTLSGANSYTGQTALRHGTLVAGSDVGVGVNGALGNAGSAILVGDTVTPVSNVAVASTGNITALTGLLTIDGVTLVAGDRVLVKDQNTSSSNGIWVVAATAWVRATDANDASELARGLQVTVNAGTQNTGKTYFANTPSTITVNTTPLIFHEDIVNPNVSFLTNGAHTIARPITVVANGAGVSAIGAANTTGTTAIYSGGVTLNKPAVLTSLAAGATTEFSGLINDGAGSFGITINGGSNAGTVKLSSASGNTYDGGTTVSSGTLVVSNTSGLATGTGTTLIAAGGKLTGSGILGAVTIAGNGTLSPGNSPGTLNTGAETWNAGGTYLWEINDATLANKGVDAGYDWVNIAGTLDLMSIIGGPGNQFTINASSMGSSAANFDPGTSYNWVIATASDGILGFSASQFLVQNNIVGADGTFSVAIVDGVSSDDLVLSYTAVPEPAMVGTLGMLIGLMGGRRRRR